MEIIEKAIECDTKIVYVKGRLDDISSPEFEKQMLNWIDSGQIRFIIDLSELDYISSAGLRSILVASKQLKAKSGRLSLCALKGSVKDVFDISGLTLLIPIYESLKAAIDELK